MDPRPALVMLVTTLGAACARPAPSPTADAADRRELSIAVPAALQLARSLGSLGVSFDPATRSRVAVTVDPGMTVGVETRSFVYPRGRERPAGGGRRLTRPGPELALDGAEWAVPADETRYVAEVELVVFETDAPPGQPWDPRAGRYQVLWTRTLRQAEE